VGEDERRMKGLGGDRGNVPRSKRRLGSTVWLPSVLAPWDLAVTEEDTLLALT